MLNGNNIPTVIQKDNQAETVKHKQDKTVLKSNESSSQSLSKSDSNTLMAFPLSHFCCRFLFRKIKSSLNSVLLPLYQCWGPTLLQKFPKGPLLASNTSSLCFPFWSTDNLLNVTFFTMPSNSPPHLAPLLSSLTKSQKYQPSFCSLDSSYHRDFALAIFTNYHLHMVEWPEHCTTSESTNCMESHWMVLSREWHAWNAVDTAPGYRTKGPTSAMFLQSFNLKGSLLSYCYPSGLFLFAKPLATKMRNCHTSFKRAGIQHVCNPISWKN